MPKLTFPSVSVVFCKVCSVNALYPHTKSNYSIFLLTESSCWTLYKIDLSILVSCLYYAGKLHITTHYISPLICWTSWSYGSWIYNCLCNQCPSPLTFNLWVRITLMGRCTRYNIIC
jgi:hypothetical protein